MEKSRLGSLTFSATHIVAFSVVAALAAFSAGIDSCDDCGLLPDAHAQTVTIYPSDSTQVIGNKFLNIARGGIVTFSSGTHTDIGHIWQTTKPMIITGTPPDPNGATPEERQGTVLTGDSSIQVRSNNITVQNLTFKDITWPGFEYAAIDIYRDQSSGTTLTHNSNVTISNNTIVNTGSYGIRLGINDDSTYTNIRVSDNVLRDIGMNYPDTFTAQDRANHFQTAIIAPSKGLMKNLFISNNIIDNTTYAGINLTLTGVVNAHVNGNTISNTPTFGIQKGVEAEVGGVRLSGTDSSLSIYNNTITNANSSLQVNELADNTAPEAAIIVEGHDGHNVRVYENVIRDSHNGILLCADISCGVHEVRLGVPTDTFTAVDVDQFSAVFRNSFINNTGYDLVNVSSSPAFAPFNYWDRSPEQRISGNVVYSPYYTNEARTILAELSTSQSSISSSTPSCSVSTGAPITFNLVTGGESPAASQTIRNAGSLAVTGVQVSVDAWTDAGDNEYSTLTTFVRTGGEFRELTPGQYLSVDSGLSAPASSSALEFKVVHSGRTLPAGEGTLSQTISLFGSCG